jgi:hypothetical protein
LPASTGRRRSAPWLRRQGHPLAGQGDAAIKSGEKDGGDVDLVAGPVDEALLTMVGRPTGAPRHRQAFTDPNTFAGGAVQRFDAPASGASTAPAHRLDPARQASRSGTIAPPADATVGGGAAAGGGGGVLASATPSPAGGVTVLPGNAYSGPVTVLP